ncbi:hypothetical protein Y032_0514g2770 [Ancylostoma ceylanicum]|uniref:Uncharacterized protein n=1 Tax=Ancylostoma ceylanicum TaxID=53326 RepID=A0A016WT84_9BILA|nr:hypothetical protein Y032_0514g2770 [Ancylostoma ceylanicum]
MSRLSVSGCPFSLYLGVFPYPSPAPLSRYLAPDADKAKMGRFNCQFNFCRSGGAWEKSPTENFVQCHFMHKIALWMWVLPRPRRVDVAAAAAAIVIDVPCIFQFIKSNG